MRRSPLSALVVAAVLVACAPLLVHGFPKGTDWSLELVRIAEYRRAWAEPPRPPAWAGDLYAGFGAPVFVYYPPLFSLLSAALAGSAGSLWNGAVAALVLLTALAATGVRRLPGALGDDPDGAAGRVAAYALVLNPYLLCDALLRNANAELAALALAPVALLGAARLPQRPRSGVALLSGGLALCVLAHNLTALALTAALVGALALDGRAGRPALAAAGLALGLALAAFYWLPALVYLPLMRSEELLTGKFAFERNFASPFEAFGYARFFAAGLAPPALLAAAALALPRARGRARRWLLACLTAAVVCVFLLTPASAALWPRIPLLALFQFPWRFLGPLALFASLAAGLAFATLARGRTRRTRVLAEVAIFALCTANALPVLLRAQPLDPEPRARLSQRLSRPTIRSQALGVTVRDEYLPRGADGALWREARYLEPPVLSAVPDARISVGVNRDTSIALDVECAAATHLRIARWQFPGWRARIDGTPAAFDESPDGVLALEVPAGRHALEVVFRGPPVRTALLPLSGAALLAWLGLALSLPRRRPASPKST